MLLVPDKPTNFGIKVPLFGGVLEVCICECKDLDGWSKPPEDAMGAYHNEMGKIWINNQDVTNDVEFMAAISHECCHAAFGTAWDISSGEYPSDMVGEELVCYLQDYFFAEIIDTLVNMRDRR